MSIVNVKCLAEDKLLDVKLICKKRRGERNKISLTGIVRQLSQQKYLIDIETCKSFGEGTQVTGVFSSEKIGLKAVSRCQI